MPPSVSNPASSILGMIKVCYKTFHSATVVYFLSMVFFTFMSRESPQSSLYVLLNRLCVCLSVCLYVIRPLPRFVFSEASDFCGRSGIRHKSICRRLTSANGLLMYWRHTLRWWWHLPIGYCAPKRYPLAVVYKENDLYLPSSVRSLN